jgi:hypothetical protein
MLALWGGLLYEAFRPSAQRGARPLYHLLPDGRRVGQGWCIQPFTGDVQPFTGNAIRVAHSDIPMSYDSSPPETAQAARLVALECYTQAIQRELVTIAAYLDVVRDYIEREDH